MNRPQAAATAALTHRLQLDPLDVGIAEIRDLSGRLTPSDREFLRRAHEKPVDVEATSLDAYSLGWFIFYKLVDLWVDPGDRTWVRTTRLGVAVAGEQNPRSR